MREDDGVADASLVAEALEGLRQPQKTLPPKLFYDAEGCRLFARITELPEYYVTRAERALLLQTVPKLDRDPDAVVVEYGGSDEAKALALIDRLGADAYVPIDVAAEALDAMRRRLLVQRPGLTVHPVVADFTRPLRLPDLGRPHRPFGFFPGSTIGNLDPTAAGTFLRGALLTLGRDCRFLLGVDLRKDAAILVPAYSDAQGVTAAFNRNALSHLNRLARADFDPADFDHRAVWNEAAGRIEMHLVSRKAQTVFVDGFPIRFAAGEWIHTESSYKHTVDSFLAIATQAGWASAAVWTDPAGTFSLHLLTPAAER